MADTAKKGKGGNQKKDQPATNVKESKEEVVAPTPAVAEPAVAVNPNTNKPDPVVVPGKNATKPPKKERVYQQGRGTVKSVLSGDTLIVLQMDNGKPVEKEIQMTNIEAPKLGRRKKDERTNDEPYAFASREFLRKTAIGHNVSYTVEVKSGNEKGSREYGYVYLNKDNTQQDLAQLLVEEGWCRVRRRNKEGQTQEFVRPEVEELNKLEQVAIEKKKGVHNKAGEAKAVRPLNELSSMDAFEQNKKGAPVQAIVERVLSGSTLYLTLLPSLNEVRLTLSGVECPRTDPLEPFGREAKFCTEFFLLNRDVSVIFEGADKSTLYGTIDFRGNNISEELLKRGLAKYVEWSGARTAFVERLKAAEKLAKSKHLCRWEKYVEPKAAPGEGKQSNLKPGFVLQGKVTAIQTASVITVVDQTGKEYEVQLSSIIAPKGGKMKFDKDNKKKDSDKEKSAEKPAEKPRIVGEDVKPTAAKKPQLTESERKDALERTYAWEAKEYLRKRLIGQRVKCVLDYIQTPEDQAKTNKGGAVKPGQDKTRYCYSVYPENNKNNVAVELCTQGLATPRNHRGGDERSKDYEDMLKAETIATSQKKGQHKKPENASILVINDITGDEKLATQHLASMNRGRHRGVVQHVFHSGRFKIYVPTQSCELSVALSGIQTPKDQTKDKPKDLFFDEAYTLIRDKIYQRDVEFEVNRVDKGGNFGGSVYINKENLSTILLNEGYAKLIDVRSVKDLPDYSDLKNAEDNAKRHRKNLWKDYDEAAERKKFEEKQAEREGKRELKESSRYKDVIVTEIVDAQNFYVQLVEDAAKLDELMKKLAVDDVPASSEPFKAGDVVRAQYTADDTWYRATITSVDGANYKVLYVDYGNSETIPASRIKPISPQLIGKDALGYQARKAHLAFVQAQGLNDDYGQEAAELLRELVENKQLSAQDEYSAAESEDMYLSLMDGDTHLGAVLVREGLARVKKPRGRDWNMPRRNKEYQDKLVSELKEQEKIAKDARLNVWEFGDYASDDEDDRPRGGKKDNKKKTSTTSSPAAAKKDGAK